MKPELHGTYTWDDYLKWEREERWELIDGKPYQMGSPGVLHQAILGGLYAQMHTHFKGHSCKVFLAPLDVKLSVVDVVQPDLLVICRPQDIHRTHIEGPPELVVEIGSPTTVRHDRLRKLNLYARAGIQEYWLVTPAPFLVEVMRNQGERFLIEGAYMETDSFTSPTFPELRIDLAQLDLPFPDQVRESSPAYT